MDPIAVCKEKLIIMILGDGTDDNEKEVRKYGEK